MASSTLQRHRLPETESEWKQFSEKIAGRFTIDRARPHWPDAGALLSKYNILRIEDWETAEGRWNDYALAEYFHPSHQQFECQLMHGTCQLHIDIRQAAHKRLFGFYTDAPSQMAIRAIGFAMFNPFDQYFDLRRQQSWESVCRYASNEHRRRIELNAALDDLLTELET